MQPASSMMVLRTIPLGVHFFETGGIPSRSPAPAVADLLVDHTTFGPAAVIKLDHDLSGLFGHIVEGGCVDSPDVRAEDDVADQG